MRQQCRPLDSLAFQFFKLFAQYKSTLKERRFFRVNGNRTQVDWNRFAVEYILDRHRKG
jgi:hypothetical protein